MNTKIIFIDADDQVPAREHNTAIIMQLMTHLTWNK